MTCPWAPHRYALQRSAEAELQSALPLREAQSREAWVTLGKL